MVKIASINIPGRCAGSRDFPPDATQAAARLSAPQAKQRGFALIITLTLLALLALTVFALSALNRVSAQIATIAVYQMQARQNALLGLNLGLGELQQQAGDDARLTGMAGLTGISALAGNSTRHWCGVWEQGTGAFVGWLASGAQTTSTAAVQSGLSVVELVGPNTVGAAAANSEHSIAGKIPLWRTDTAAAPGSATLVGNYAYLVIDEGVKITAYAPDALLRVAGLRPVLTSTVPTSAAGKLAAALAAYAGKLPGIISYEQLSLLPTPNAALTPSVLQDNFNHVTLTNRTLSGSDYFSGSLNLNTTSTIFWRSVLETYNTAPGVVPITSSNLTAKGNALGNGLAATNLGKMVNGPFSSPANFSAYLATIFPLTGSPTYIQIMAVLGPLLTVRSDTFRIRAYGEAVNSLATVPVEARAVCEAIVQRTPLAAPNGLGRKFVLIDFRWLGPNDL